MGSLSDFPNTFCCSRKGHFLSLKPRSPVVYNFCFHRFRSLGLRTGINEHQPFAWQNPQSPKVRLARRIFDCWMAGPGFQHSKSLFFL